MRIIPFEYVFKKKRRKGELTESAPLDRSAPFLNKSLDRVLPSGFRPMSKRKRYLSSYSLNNLKGIKIEVDTYGNYRLTGKREVYVYLKKKKINNNSKYLLVDSCSQKGSGIMTIGETD